MCSCSSKPLAHHVHQPFTHLIKAFVLRYHLRAFHQQRQLLRAAEGVGRVRLALRTPSTEPNTVSDSHSLPAAHVVGLDFEIDGFAVSVAKIGVQPPAECLGRLPCLRLWIEHFGIVTGGVIHLVA